MMNSQRNDAVKNYLINEGKKTSDDKIIKWNEIIDKNLKSQT